MRKTKLLIWIISITLVLLLSIGACALYVSDYYRADSESIEAFTQGMDVNVTMLDGAIAYGTGEEDIAFIFYPGGKVEYISYEPIMKLLASRGVLCIIAEMPFNLAVLDVNAADDIRNQYPYVKDWYIGGHSLGGSMAASHLGSNLEKYQGLILLGSYSTQDLSDADIDVLSIYGSEDKVMNLDKYIKYRSNLPEDFTEIIIEGGCHAYFGMYGEQEGDGTPTLTQSEQIWETAAHIYDFIKGEYD